LQRGHSFAIVDEVDSILVDEARTPLIISGPTEDRTDLYRAIDTLIPQLKAPTKQGKDATPEERGDYEVDEKQRQTTLTDAGNEHMVQLLLAAGLLESGDLYDIENISLVHHVNQALKAHKLFQKDKDYIVKNSKVIIIDEFTGRMMEGRRYSDGLHQALEAKEGATVEPENVTLASITFQKLFPPLRQARGHDRHGPDRGGRVHGHLQARRARDPDQRGRAARGPRRRGLPQLRREERGDRQADRGMHRARPADPGRHDLDREVRAPLRSAQEGQITHNVLNARYHEQEAMIVSQAGRSGAVTIATNMAGRGTDIQLGGNFDMRVRNELAGELDEAVRAQRIEAIRAEIAEDKKKALAAGGLYVIGTERHESRRIDNQLRGRSGRQGDPGASKFFLSLQDDLMRIFGSERMDSILVRLGLEEGEAITHPWVNKALEKAQQKVESA